MIGHEIQRRFDALLGKLLDNLIQLAAIVKEADAAKYEITGNPRLIGILRKIAYGQLDGPMAAAFLGNALLMRRLSSLPMPDQKRVAKDPAIPVALPGGDVAKLAPSKMGPRVIEQVFSHEGIRTVEQQRTWLINRSAGEAVAVDDYGEIRILKGRIYVPSPRHIGRGELGRLLKELESQS